MQIAHDRQRAPVQVNRTFGKHKRIIPVYLRAHGMTVQVPCAFDPEALRRDRQIDVLIQHKSANTRCKLNVRVHKAHVRKAAAVVVFKGDLLLPAAVQYHLMAVGRIEGRGVVRHLREISGYIHRSGLQASRMRVTLRLEAAAHANHIRRLQHFQFAVAAYYRYRSFLVRRGVARYGVVPADIQLASVDVQRAALLVQIALHLQQPASQINVAGQRHLSVDGQHMAIIVDLSNNKAVLNGAIPLQRQLADAVAGHGVEGNGMAAGAGHDQVEARAGIEVGRVLRRVLLGEVALEVERAACETVPGGIRLHDEVAVHRDHAGAVGHVQRAVGIAVAAAGQALHAIVAVDDQRAAADGQRAAGVDEVAVDDQRVAVQVQTAVGQGQALFIDHVEGHADVGLHDALPVLSEDRAGETVIEPAEVPVRDHHALGAAGHQPPVLKVNDGDGRGVAFVDVHKILGRQRLHAAREDGIVLGLHAHGGEGVDAEILAIGGVVGTFVVGGLGLNRRGHADVHIGVRRRDQHVHARRDLQGSGNAAPALHRFAGAGEALAGRTGAFLRGVQPHAEGAAQVRLQGELLLQRYGDADLAYARDAHLAQRHIREDVLRGHERGFDIPAAAQCQRDIAAGYGMGQLQVGKGGRGGGIPQRDGHPELAILIAQTVATANVLAGGNDLIAHVRGRHEFVHVRRDPDLAGFIQMAVERFIGAAHRNDSAAIVHRNGIGHIADGQILQIDHKGVARRDVNRTVGNGNDIRAIVDIDARSTGHLDDTLRERARLLGERGGAQQTKHQCQHADNGNYAIDWLHNSHPPVGMGRSAIAAGWERSVILQRVPKPWSSARRWPRRRDSGSHSSDSPRTRRRDGPARRSGCAGLRALRAAGWRDRRTC